MTARLLITIDTESDMPNWRPQRVLRLDNLRYLERLQRLFDRYGVLPTYLITYPVATSTFAMEILREILGRGACEIGAHLHPWTTPPLEEAERLQNVQPHRLPVELQRRKLETLTRAVTEAIGCAPRSYRAGRFGFDGNGLRVIEELGYEVDSSVTSLKSWEEEDGPDYRLAPIHPYHPDPVDVTREGRSKVLEVPVTAGFSRSIPDWAKKLFFALPHGLHLRGFLHRLKLLQLVSLRPWIYSAEEMISVSKLLLERGQPVLNMMFHSSDIYPGANPNCQSEEDSQRFLAKLDRYLEAMLADGLVESRTLGGYRDEFLGAAKAGERSPREPVRLSSPR